MIRSLMVCLLTAAIAGSALGADAVNGRFIGVGPTVLFGDFSGLNDAFARQGIGKLSSTHATTGCSGFSVFGRAVFGFAGWDGDQTVSSESLTAKVTIRGGEFNIGYCVVKQAHLLVAPVLGIGGNVYDIALAPVNSDFSSFDNLLQHPRRTSSASSAALLLSPQLMVTVPISFVGLQLRGGYQYQPANSKWELSEGGQLREGPSIAKGTPFVALSVVFGPTSKLHRNRSNG